MAEEAEIPTNYTKAYAITRGWGQWEMVREFVQNSLDATNSVSIEKKSDGLLITDKGKGFNALNLLMGTSTKSPCDRGRFGEGMKIACLAGLNLGYEIKIETDSMLVKPVFKELEIIQPLGEVVKAEIMVFKYTEIPDVGGTKVFIKGYKGDTYLDRFNLEYNKRIISKKELNFCEQRPYPSYIIEESVSGIIKNRIYVRNIFVQEIPKDKISLFSYDLFNVKLSTDRNIPAFEDIWDEIGKLWSAVSDARMIEQFFKHIKDTDEAFEKEVQLSTNIMERFDTKAAWVRGYKSIFGANTFLTTNDETTRKAEYHSKFAKKGVVLPTGIRYVLNRIGIETDTTVLKKIKRVLPMLPKKESLTTTKQLNFNYLLIIHYRLKDKYISQLRKLFLGTQDTMIDIMGSVIDENIYIREDAADTMVHLIDVYGHEATHIAFPELSDNTSAFYAKIGQVMALITKAIVTDAALKPPEGVVW